MIKFLMGVIAVLMLIVGAAIFISPNQALNKLETSKIITTDVGTGSGVAISDKYILTNHHVVGGSKTVTYEDSNGSIHDAVVKYINPDIDIAVIESKDKIEKYAEISCRLPKFGDKVTIIGRVEHFNWIFTSGFISSSRVVKYIQPLSEAAKAELGEDFLIINASLSFGASGSPVFYENGTTVVGIAGAIFNSLKTGDNLNKSGAVAMYDLCPWLETNKIDYTKTSFINELMNLRVDSDEILNYINSVKGIAYEKLYEVLSRA